MNFSITGDIDAKSGVGDVIYSFAGPTRRHFSSLKYGDGLSGIAVILMCQDPALALKQRVRHSKKEQRLYIDVMLSLLKMESALPPERKKIVFHEIISQTGALLAKRKIADFDYDHFLSDLRAWTAVNTKNQK